MPSWHIVDLRLESSLKEQLSPPQQHLLLLTVLSDMVETVLNS